MINWCKICGKEEWRDIEGYDGFYQISDKGRVKSIKRQRVLSGRKYIVNKEKILKPYKHNGGYLKINLCKDGKVKSFFIHRLILQAFKPTKEKLNVNHIDGNKENNNLENLEWVTQKENVRHAYESGLNKTRRKVICLETGKIYKSITECAKDNKVSLGSIHGACKGLYKTSKGKHYKYYE